MMDSSDPLADFPAALRAQFAADDAEATRQEIGSPDVKMGHGPKPMAPQQTEDYALGWLTDALRQIATNDPNIGNLTEAEASEGYVFMGVRVFGHPISITLNISR